VKELRISDIRIDGGTQIRKELNQDKVDQYAEQMTEGVVFPPVTVFFDGSSYWLSSGFHRYWMHKKLDKETILADIKEGTVEDATLFALGDNKHGLNMTAEDYRRSIEIMLKHPKWSTWSNIQIAKHIGVSATTISRHKKAQEPAAEPKKKTYIDKHGNESSMDTSKIGRKPKVEEEENVSPITDEKDQTIAELTDTVNLLAEENTLFRDKIAMGQWNASEIEKIDIEETVANLRERNRILEIENKALRESRDMFQNRNAELIKTINAMKRKDKK
jgi:transposase